MLTRLLRLLGSRGRQRFKFYCEKLSDPILSFPTVNLVAGQSDSDRGELVRMGISYRVSGTCRFFSGEIPVPWFPVQILSK